MKYLIPSSTVLLLILLAVHVSAAQKGWITTIDLTGTFATPTPTPSGATYFISPTGSDSNNGLTSGTPWLTPNHALNCGDVILAAAGTYAEANFRIGRYGTVTCPANNNVAWLKCSTFDTCKINITGSNDGMDPGVSYWGIQGWEVSTLANNGNNQCFNAFPTTVNIHHIIFANDIANGCGASGIAAGGNNPIGPDYIAMIGNISYNAAQDSAHCYSGFDLLTPANADTVAGTHIYIAGNFSWGNVDPNPCVSGPGGVPTDGEGINLDTIGGNGYTGQIVVYNNISVFNGGPGIMPFSNQGSPAATVIVSHNTTYGNQTGGVNQSPCPELNANFTFSTTFDHNLAQTTAATACSVSGSPQPYFAFGASGTDSTVQVTNNFFFSAAGNNTLGTATYSGNLTGTSPSFANPVKPPAPNCSGKTDVHDCMSTVISNYTPSNGTATAYGYQQPSGTSIHDTLFPQWLCHVTNLPPGLITMGCS